ncbi:hypothetical protein [Actomonas aquatica]|uniref:Glycosyltransferase RgtA/B/C/D-like domain-containing protein n=1 Tax=Actomonas aquatica TaxID=2866162 RepID=A0ABZ1CB98_9BACT|nr:hypothetical protein [Opitutus sp. WL0086]WRQ88508.1 hypothetical protein K1X11_003775 [Opitutus sp. WL0086]
MPDQPPATRALWLAALGGALLALAAHLDLIAIFGTVLPYRDQWQLTGVELLGPWVDGNLTGASFLQPLNDHWPVLTRVLSFALLRLNGQWNNLVETTFNAFILAGAIAVFLRGVLPAFGPRLRVVFALFTGAVMALPIGWENTLWGIQSLPYTQILLSVCYLYLLTSRTSRDAVWWLAQLAGVLVLFTQHSAILAHFALLPICVWRFVRNDGDRSLHALNAALAAITILAFFTLFPSIETTAHLAADSIPLALEVGLRQLAFPTAHPAWAFLLWAPWLLLPIDRFARRRLDTPTAFVLVLGLWVGGQAAAIGYGRAAETYTFASRYCDFLLLGFATNGAAVLLLWQAWPRRLVRVATVVLATLWLLVPLEGFWWESTQSHAGFNLSNRFRENPANLQRVHDYIATRDPAVLSLERGGALLFTYPPSVQALLDKAGVRAYLPPETGAPEARDDHGRLGGITHLILDGRLLIALLGFAGLGASLLVRRPSTSTADADVGPSTWTAPRLWWSSTSVVLTFAALWSTWELPLEFDATERIRQLMAPADPGLSFADLSFHYEGHGEVDTSQTPGAVLSEPETWRPFTHGTAFGGKTNGFQGTLASAPIPITADTLSVLFTGFPCAHGNGMRWKLLPPDGGEPQWSGYDGPNPESGWYTWTIDTSAHRGWNAVLYLFDGRPDREGWLGVTRPVFTDDPTWAAGWQARLRAERAAPAHRTLAGATLVSGSLWLLGGVVLLFSRRLRSPS